jgi:hypothetical protein
VRFSGSRPVSIQPSPFHLADIGCKASVCCLPRFPIITAASSSLSCAVVPLQPTQTQPCCVWPLPHLQPDFNCGKMVVQCRYNHRRCILCVYMFGDGDTTWRHVEDVAVSPTTPRASPVVPHSGLWRNRSHLALLWAARGAPQCFVAAMEPPQYFGAQQSHRST